MKRFAFIIAGLAAVLSAMAQDAGTGFNFEKYQAAMQEWALPRFMKSADSVRFMDYALIDIDNDGKPEVWVRSDEGQDWQGVFALEGDSVMLLADADVTSELSFYTNAVGFSGYISPGLIDEGFSVLKDSHIIASCNKHLEIDIFSDMETLYEEYIVNGESTDEDGYNAFVQKLGDAITVTPVWHKIE